MNINRGNDGKETNGFRGTAEGKVKDVRVKRKGDSIMIAEGIIDGKVDEIESVYIRGVINSIRYIFKELIPKLLFYLLTHIL
jgi:hypothetical protein